MIILGFDPGPDKSAWVIYETTTNKVLNWSNDTPNEALFESIRVNMMGMNVDVDQVFCESVVNYGMAVGASTFGTAYMVGRIQQWSDERGIPNHLVTNREVANQLTGSTRAKDKHTRRALLDRFPNTGGGKTPEIGIKKQPGPLYGCAGEHFWSALGVAVYGADHMKGLTK